MKIKDICTFVTDGSHNPPQGIEKSEYMMLSSKNIFDDEITFDEPRFLSQKDFEREHKRTKIVVGDVLLTIVGTVGRTAVVDEDMPTFALQRSVAVLHPKNDVCLPRFLMYALRGKRTYIENRAKGVAQKGIYLKEVSDIDIYIPDISNQEIIINKLDKVNAVIKFRQEELLALDNLIKARFVEMFGDPTTNPKGYPIKVLSEIAEYWNGLTYKPEDVSDEGIIVLRSSNIQNATLDFADIVRVSCKIGDKKYVQDNDILMCSKPLDLSEYKTRKLYIDAMLMDTGWKEGIDWINEVELPGMPNKSEIGRADYVLYDDASRPLAIVEAKRTCVDVSKGRQQAKLYADILEEKYKRRPVIFLTNGFETHIIDGQYPERKCAAIYSKRDLEKWFNLLTIKQ